MDKSTKILRIIFVLSAVLLLITITSTPKTHCQNCEIEYGGHEYDGYEAYEFFEIACIDYSRPEDYFYVDIDDINLSYTDNGFLNITFDNEVRR